MAKKIVIVGGVAGGASTAARLRRLDEGLEIVILEKGDAISYANCGLPYYIGGVISDREALFLQTPEAMKNRFNIDVRVRNEAVRIERDRKEVVVRDLERGDTYRETYDKLVLSPGSTPIIPDVPGIRLPNVFTLRNIPDTDRIRNHLREHGVRSAVVVGGGFIGVEMAENLAEAGKKVTLVELADQVLRNLDYEMAAIVHQELRGRGIDLMLGNGLAQIGESGNSLEVTLNDGGKIVADMVILAVARKRARRGGRAGPWDCGSDPGQ